MIRMQFGDKATPALSPSWPAGHGQGQSHPAGQLARAKPPGPGPAISIHFLSPVLSVLLFYSRLAPGLVARTVKRNRQLGLTVLKQGHRSCRSNVNKAVHVKQ